MKHLVKSQNAATLYTEDVWCPGKFDPYPGRGTSEDIDDVDCPECLKKASYFGSECEARLAFLEGK